MAVPRVLVADLGGVCCAYRPERRLTALADISGLEPVEVYARVFGSGLAAKANSGALTAAQTWQSVSAALGLDMPPAALNQTWASAFEPDQAVLDVIDSVRPRLRTALLTNNGPLLRDGLLVHRPTVVVRFDVLLFSCDLGAAKPDPAAFTAATAALSVEPDEVLFVDDDLDNVEAASDAGWAAVLHTTASALADHLAAHLTTTTTTGVPNR